MAIDKGFRSDNMYPYSFVKAGENHLELIEKWLRSPEVFKWYQDSDYIEDLEEGLSDMIITTKDAKRNPYFNMVKKNSQGFVKIVNSSNGDKKYINRQSAPDIFDVTTVAYVSSPEFILNSNSVFDGKVSSVHIPEERALDIDNMYDMDIAELLIKKGK